MSFVNLVEVWRGPLVESCHRGVAAVANARGEILAGWGDTALVTFPRSALKPIQAIALVESGAYAAAGLTLRHLAIACASHRGEPMHSTLIAGWLASMGLDQACLVCGPDRPADEAAAAAAVLEGRPRQRVYHNCSGKHCGFLAVSRHYRWPLQGYDEIDHPAQQQYLDALSELVGAEARALPFGIDGCALPAPALSVAAMASTMARFADAKAASPGRRAAMLTIQEAMRTYPELLSGTGQPGTVLAAVTGGRIVVKTGAEGFISAFLPGLGIGVALKIADGEARARVPALLAVLTAAGLLDATEQQALAPLAEPAVLNSAGTVVGRIRATLPAG